WCSWFDRLTTSVDRYGALPTLTLLDPDGLELAALEVARVDAEREDGVGARGAGDAAVLRRGFDALPVDLEQHRPPLDAAVERRAHALDPGAQHAADVARHVEAVGHLAIEIADAQAERRVLGVGAVAFGRRRR